MVLANHADVVQAINDLREVRVTFRSKEDGGAALTRRCAPIDYGPSRRAHDKTPRYHFWDFESDSPKPHVLSLLPSQIIGVELLDSTFDPESFVTWNTASSPWSVIRSSWGAAN